MQIRSGVYRVPSEPRSIPAERDAGRNRAILSIGDSLARLEPIKFSRRSRHCDRRRVIGRGAFLSDIYYRLVFDAGVDYGTCSQPCLIDTLSTSYSCTWPRLQGTRPLHEFLSSAFLSSKDYLNLSRVVEDFHLFPRENYPPDECFVSNMLRDPNFWLTQNMYLQIIIV